MQERMLAAMSTGRKQSDRTSSEAGECGLPGMGCGRAGQSGAAPWRDPPGAHQVVGLLNGYSEAATEPEGELGPGVLMPLTSSGYRA